MTINVDRIFDHLSLLSALAAALLAAGLLVRALKDHAAIGRSGENGALLIVSVTAIAIEALRLAMAALLLAYAALTWTMVGISLQFHISRWLHISMAAMVIISALYHARQRRRLMALLRAERRHDG